MSDSNSAVLQRAYELVEAGQADEARFLVESVLDSEKTNPDAWWIYAHAVDDPVRARQALDQVQALDPNYPGAADLINVLEAQYPGATEAAQQAPPILPLAVTEADTGEEADGSAVAGAAVVAGAVGVAAVLSGTDDADDAAEPAEPVDEPSDEPAEEPEFVGQVPPATVTMVKEERRGLPWLWYFAAAAGIVLLLALLLALLGNPASTLVSITQEPDATQVAGQPTLDAGAQIVIETDVAVLALTQAVLQGGGEVTSEATDLVLATSEPLLPQPTVVATLPESLVVTLTPLPAGEPTVEVVEVIVGVTTEPDMEATEVVVEVTEVPDLQPTEFVAPDGVNVPDGVLPFDDLTQLAAALAAFSAPETALTTEVTALGPTLVGGFCTQDGPELRDLTPQVMDAMAVRAPLMEPRMTAVGVRAVDCATGQTLRLIVAGRAAATTYTEGGITRELFESQWLSL